MKLKSWHFALMVVGFVVTALLERKLLPEGTWREVGFIANGVIGLIAVKMAEMYQGEPKTLADTVRVNTNDASPK